MISFIHCKNCLKQLSLLNNMTVTVKFSISRIECKECNNVVTTDNCDYLCSQKCFLEYISNYLKKHIS